MKTPIKGSFIFAAYVPFICAFVLVQQGASRSDRSRLSESASAEAIPQRHQPPAKPEACNSNIALPGEVGQTKPGQFPPNTKAGHELEKILYGKDKDIDLALANWLIATDIPEFHDLTREAYFAQLDAMTEQVRGSMAIMQASGYGGMDSDNPRTRSVLDRS